jgi:hypothetical protein
VFPRHFKLTRSAHDKGDQIVVKVTNYDTGFSLNDLPMEGAGQPGEQGRIHAYVRALSTARLSRERPPRG